MERQFHDDSPKQEEEGHSFIHCLCALHRGLKKSTTAHNFRKHLVVGVFSISQTNWANTAQTVGV